MIREEQYNNAQRCMQYLQENVSCSINSRLFFFDIAKLEEEFCVGSLFINTLSDMGYIRVKMDKNSNLLHLKWLSDASINRASINVILDRQRHFIQLDQSLERDKTEMEKMLFDIEQSFESYAQLQEASFLNLRQSVDKLRDALSVFMR